ncbi:hypothetical protein L1887_07538 [Cichorium endivia]|nr:hypothetical protein L1887_07538 [Cichorium endivia]
MGFHGTLVNVLREKEAENFGNPLKEINVSMISSDDVDLFDLYLNVDVDAIVYYADTEGDYQQNLQAEYETYVGEQLAVDIVENVVETGGQGMNDNEYDSNSDEE